MVQLKKEQIILVIIMGLIIVLGLGVLLWQNLTNKIVIENMAVDQEKDYNVEIPETEEKKKIVVHVTGEVKNTGVFELEENSRVIDAIIAAGGETKLADLDNLNLAAPIYDGEKIYVPSIIDTVSKGEKNNTGHNKQNSNKIDINSATVEEFQQLPGIGPSKAKNIIEYRQKVGRFAEINELLEVTGIGEKTLNRIRDKLTIR